jgi:hypothetical protein
MCLIVIHKMFGRVFLSVKPPLLRNIFRTLETLNRFINLYPTNAPDPFKSESYERNKWVSCGHLNSPHSHVQA